MQALKLNFYTILHRPFISTDIYVWPFLVWTHCAYISNSTLSLWIRLINTHSFVVALHGMVRCNSRVVLATSFPFLLRARRVDGFNVLKSMILQCRGSPMQYRCASMESQLSSAGRSRSHSLGVRRCGLRRKDLFDLSLRDDIKYLSLQFTQSPTASRTNLRI
jgi:hypothetical protein